MDWNGKHNDRWWEDTPPRQITPIIRYFNIWMFLGNYSKRAREVWYANKMNPDWFRDVEIYVEMIQHSFEMLDTNKKWKKVHKDLCRIDEQVRKASKHHVQDLLTTVPLQITRMCEDCEDV